MDKNNLEKFDPTAGQLHTMIAQTVGITASDLTDLTQLAIVKKNRIALRDARIKIEKVGKDLRSDALAFQKSVIAKERDLIAIIEPEENRLSKIEEEAKALAIKKERMAKLPERKTRLAAMGIVTIDPLAFGISYDDLLLSKDDMEFEVFINEKFAEKNERQRLANEAKAKADAEIEQKRIDDERKKLEQEKLDHQKKIDDERLAHQEKVDEDNRKIDDEKRRLENERVAREREDKAREDERKRIEQEAKDEENRKALAKKEQEEKERKQKEKIEADKKYNDFLTLHGVTDENKDGFYFLHGPAGIQLYKHVAFFKFDV